MIIFEKSKMLIRLSGRLRVNVNELKSTDAKIKIFANLLLELLNSITVLMHSNFVYRETGRVLSIFERQVSVSITEDKAVQHSIHHVGSSSLVMK